MIVLSLQRSGEKGVIWHEFGFVHGYNPLSVEFSSRCF